MNRDRKTDIPLELRELPGSERSAAPGVRAPGAAVPADVRVDATLVLRRRAELPDAIHPDSVSPHSVSPRDEEPMTSTALGEQFGASEVDLELVSTTLMDLGITIVASDAASRRVRVSGSNAVMSRVFGTSLDAVTSEDGFGKAVSHRHRTGGLSVPAALDGIVTAVLGLDDRPQARARFRTAAAAAANRSYTPIELGEVYNFPAGTDGAGETLAIIELGGGFAQAELDTYFSGLGITGPQVTAVGVDGAVNKPGADPNGADGEVLLDIEVAGALAPKASIVVYFAPNTDAGFLDAISEAAHATPPPAAMSISWGQSEDEWTGQARTAFDDALADAAVLGVTVTAAAGDDGSTDRAADGKSHVDFPASSPHALACGGTRLDADPTTGTVSSETVWDNGVGQGATGGGVSAAFPLPTYQSKAGVPTKAGAPGRGVPDVSAVADPQTGYQVRVDGKDTVIGGTSAVAPLWAALVVRFAQATGRHFGLVQPLLYGSVAAGTVPTGFRDITSGNNGAYSAAAGWDACTGLGVPDGASILSAVLGKAPTAPAHRSR